MPKDIKRYEKNHFARRPLTDINVNSDEVIGRIHVFAHASFDCLTRALCSANSASDPPRKRDCSLYTGPLPIIFAITRLKRELPEFADAPIPEIDRPHKDLFNPAKIGFCSNHCFLQMYECLVTGEPYELDAAVYNRKSVPCELLYGRAGLGFMIDYFKKKGMRCTRDDLISDILSDIDMHDFPWSWHGKEYFGAAHGTAGILLALKRLNGYASADIFEELIKQSFISSSGNFKSSSGSSRDELVQWCHGAPGFVSLILEYADVCPEICSQHLESALETIWQRGLLTKGSGICHGIAGDKIK